MTTVTDCLCADQKKIDRCNCKHTPVIRRCKVVYAHSLTGIRHCFPTTHLLNVQTGELEPVTFRLLGETTITVRDRAVSALHYRIENPGFSIDLWYSPAQEWLALESTTDNGARLRYLAM